MLIVAFCITYSKILQPLSKNRRYKKYLFNFRENALSEIEAKHNEVRDLILSRNELVHFLANCELEPISSECQPSQRHDIIKLPEPLTRMSTCEKCEYKLICAVYQCNSENNEKSYPIQNIGEKILRHLSKTDLIYFFKWAEILFTEEKSFSEGIYSYKVHCNSF